MKASIILIATVLFLNANSGHAQIDTVRYTVMSSGKPTGKQLQWSENRTAINLSYEFNDRGRGPKFTVKLKTDEHGLVISRQLEGIDYYKAPIVESFEISNGNASWKNHIESEQRAVNGNVLYSPLNSAPAEIEYSLHLLLKAKDHTLEVLPSGSLKAIHIKNHTAKLDGFPEELELYSFSGSGGPPSYVWFTPSKKFFAIVNGWSSILPEGKEKLENELLESQKLIEHDYFLVQAKTFTQTQSGPTVIQNVTLFDALTGKNLSNRSVIIENGVIKQVGKASKVKAPAGAKIIDGRGKTLLPGLWDNHAHYDPTQGLYHLAAGVTNIKDLANSLDLPETKKKVDNNDLLGPEISVMSGFIDFAGPFAGPTGKIVKTLEEGLEGVRYYASHGYDQVKLYSSIPPDWVKPLAAEAHRLGLKVCGHVPSYMTAERAVNDGYDQIIHLNMIMLNFLGDTLDTRSMLRFIRVAERSRNINVNGPEVKHFLQVLKEKKIVVDPTVGIFEEMFTNEPGKLAKGYDGVINQFPAEFRRGYYYGGLPTMKGHETEYKQSFDTMMKMLKLLYDNGITVVPGTDGFPGFTLHRELELYTIAGIPTKEVLKGATIVSARVAGKEKELGSIEVGKKANMILVDGDPLKNISNIRRVELTIKNGNLYDPKELYKSYGFGFWK